MFIYFSWNLATNETRISKTLSFSLDDEDLNIIITYIGYITVQLMIFLKFFSQERCLSCFMMLDSASLTPHYVPLIPTLSSLVTS